MKELNSFIKDMGSVLFAMQKLKYLHRDIKPGNILIAKHKNDKIYKLCDFGYAII